MYKYVVALGLAVGMTSPAFATSPERPGLTPVINLAGNLLGPLVNPVTPLLRPIVGGLVGNASATVLPNVVGKLVAPLNNNLLVPLSNLATPLRNR